MHCMNTKLSKLGKNSVLKKAQTFMDGKDEDGELDKVLQALPEILFYSFLCKFYVCANVCYSEIHGA